MWCHATFRYPLLPADHWYTNAVGCVPHTSVRCYLAALRCWLRYHLAPTEGMWPVTSPLRDSPIEGCCPEGDISTPQALCIAGMRAPKAHVGHEVLSTPKWGRWGHHTTWVAWALAALGRHVLGRCRTAGHRPHYLCRVARAGSHASLSNLGFLRCLVVCKRCSVPGGVGASGLVFTSSQVWRCSVTRFSAPGARGPPPNTFCKRTLKRASICTATRARLSSERAASMRWLE